MFATSLIAGSALLVAVASLWKKGIVPLARIIKTMANLRSVAKEQVVDWAEASPQIQAMGRQMDEADVLTDKTNAAGVVWRKHVDLRLDGLDTRLSILDQRIASIDRAVNHRGPEGPTLSAEQAEMAAKVDRIEGTLIELVSKLSAP